MTMYWRGNRKLEKRLPTTFLVLFVMLMMTVVFLILLGHGILSLAISSDDAGSRVASIDSIESEEEGLGSRDNQWSEIISWEPRAFLYHNFLSKEECEYLIKAAKPQMKKATVTDEKTGENVYHSARTSTGMFMNKGEGKVIQDIEKRAARYTLIPAENGEDIQVVHYEAGQKYDTHYDFFVDKSNLESMSQRAATFIMYMSDVEEGGETVFPYGKDNSSWNEVSECDKSGVSVKPRMGDALLFWNLLPDGTEDLASLHGSCPVIKGNKWVSIMVIHVKSVDVEI